jgi:hypothetical protein
VQKLGGLWRETAVCGRLLKNRIAQSIRDRREFFVNPSFRNISTSLMYAENQHINTITLILKTNSLEREFRSQNSETLIVLKI